MKKENEMNTLDESLKNSTVLITGGTGSFGSTMARHLLSVGVGEVRIFSRDEAKQDAMRHGFGEDRLKFFIGDTRDYDSLWQATRGSDFMFHAAALKQVPSAEFFPIEAVKTNILGSKNALACAEAANLKSIVCLSTDKAVYPINAMGMTKALMEKSAQAHARANPNSATRVAVTRYGNVMYSRGSVLPLFIQQIKSGKPITITDPRMTRFLMSLTESVELVKFAFQNSASGDLFVKKAPGATLEIIAEALLEMFEVQNHPVEIIGFRHGEKLYESLLGSEERAFAQDLGGYFRVPLDSRDLNYEIYYEQGGQRETDLEPYNSHNTTRLNKDEVISLLNQLPEIQKELAEWR
jgi:UDP-N-acetylglucosamine 4,6-dehydratase